MSFLGILPPPRTHTQLQSDDSNLCVIAEMYNEEGIIAFSSDIFSSYGMVLTMPANRAGSFKGFNKLTHEVQVQTLLSYLQLAWL